VAQYTSKPPVLDGRILDDEVWREVPFSDDFVDINTTTVPTFQTQMKIRYDDEWLYVGGIVFDTAIWANISHCCHCKNNSHDQIIFHDNDFEFFADLDGTTYYYKEYEMNAANANWDLCLNKPYEDGGYENSTRVFGKHGFDMKPPLISAVWINGTLNDPNAMQR
jgi:hypothetical protein